MLHTTYLLTTSLNIIIYSISHWVWNCFDFSFFETIGQFVASHNKFFPIPQNFRFPQIINQTYIPHINLKEITNNRGSTTQWASRSGSPILMTTTPTYAYKHMFQQVSTQGFDKIKNCSKSQQNYPWCFKFP